MGKRNGHRYLFAILDIPEGSVNNIYLKTQE